MRGVSRTSHAEAAERLEALLDRTQDAGARERLGTELFAVVDLLDSSVPLRRALTDPSRDGESKARLLERLLQGKVSPDTADLLGGAARSRWSAAHDLADSVEVLAVDTVLAAAETSGRLDLVEEEVSRSATLLTRDQGVRSALLERRASTGARADLVGRLVGGGAPETRMLVRRMASNPRGRRPEAAFEFVTQAAARRRQRLVAHVTVAAWPTDEQQHRLVAALTQKYGRQVRLAVDVDPSVVGGVRVQIGDDVIDGTVSRRLDEAAEQLGR
ncbi:F0F1 ATP synthase subunit delta [Aquipuribacter hungaricus]|uniref:ATP synthase subunit delta n=1 Tax=Aquipuribacter hungaricus TaxID=545624 RepID=A0ABV7WE90_9MICO